MTNKEAMRAEFESFICKRWGGSDRGELHRQTPPYDANYVNGSVDFAWAAWCASRSSADKGVPEGFSAGIEAAARLLENDADLQEKAWQEYLASGVCGPATSLHTIPREYAREVRALATEAGTESAEQWLPISSAPKDGTVILGWIVAPEIDYSNAFAAPSLMHWQLGFKSSVCNRSANWHKQWRGEPTHWMPLPKPPAPPQSAPVDGGGNEK